MSEIRQIQLDGVNYDLVITEDEVSATAAAQSAAAAAQSATQAANSASAASTSATSAGTSATNAANSAVSAENFATSAGDSATDAESSASSASDSATAAASSASSASDSADTATAAATTATTKAGEASTSATNAAGYAEDAGDYATSAETSASNAATSAAAALDAEQRAEAIVGLTIDTALSSTSRNPVENRVIKQALDNVDALPSQSGQSGKFLTTNGTAASWAAVTESDPTVPSWAKATNKPSYTASEVGAQPSITVNGILKGNGSGTISAAVAGTDYQAPGSYLSTTGGTMTGQLVTSFGAVAMGTKDGGSCTLPQLAQALRYSSGVGGSFSLTTAYEFDAASPIIPAGWYNFLWLPHRTGGNSGQASGDNCDYGTLFLSGMTDTYGAYSVRFTSGAISQVMRLDNTNNAGQWNQPAYFYKGGAYPIDWFVGNATQAHDCNTVGNNFCGYYTANGPSTALGATTADGALWNQAYSPTWMSQIASDYRTGNIFGRAKNNGNFTAWKRFISTEDIGRNDSLLAPNTSYTTLMARAESLNSADTNPSINGAISWTYA